MKSKKIIRTLWMIMVALVALSTVVLLVAPLLG